MIPAPRNFEDMAPDIHPDPISSENMRNRMHKLRTDPAYRAQQRLRAQFGQSNSMAKQGRRNVAVSLPRFSWDGQ